MILRFAASTDLGSRSRTVTPQLDPAGLFRGLARIAGRPGGSAADVRGSVGSLGPR